MHSPSFIAVALAVLPLFVSGAPTRFYGKRTAADVTVLRMSHVQPMLWQPSERLLPFFFFFHFQSLQTF